MMSGPQLSTSRNVRLKSETASASVEQVGTERAHDEVDLRRVFVHAVEGSEVVQRFRLLDDYLARRRRFAKAALPPQRFERGVLRSDVIGDAHTWCAGELVEGGEERRVEPVKEHAQRFAGHHQVLVLGREAVELANEAFRNSR